MATLAEIRTSIQLVLQDDDYGDDLLNIMVNDALQHIAGGVLMPNGLISNPIPELYTTASVVTIAGQAYAGLPDDYQRGIFFVSDSVGDQIKPIDDHGYYDYRVWLNSMPYKDLSESCSVYRVAIKGNRFYYQGVPTTPETLTIHYYRKPDTMAAGTDEPDGLPAFLAKPLLKHYVCQDIFGEGIEDGEDSAGRGAAYHKQKFYEYMQNLMDFLPEDEEAGYVNDLFDRIY